VGADSRPLDLCCGRVQPAVAAGDAVACIGRHGFCRRGLSRLLVVHVEPVRAPAAGHTRRWSGPESAAAGLRPDHPPAAVVHGLCGFFGGLCLCHRRLARRSPGCGLGTLVAALDQCRLGFSDPGYHARQLVGLLRTRLGWLVVLGSCGERILHALAGGHRARALARRDGKAWTVQELDGVAGHLCLLPEPAGYLPGALRGADLCARLCHRPRPRHVHPGISGYCYWRFTGAVCAARPGRGQPGEFHLDFPRIAVASTRSAPPISTRCSFR
jgi:hypothetical protein